MRFFRKIVSAAILLLVSFAGYAQTDTLSVLPVQQLGREQELCRAIGAGFPVPVVNYTPVTPPKFWKKGLLTELGFSQVSLTNWAAGGSGSIAFNAHINAHINYEKGNIFWENRGQFSYGFVQSFEDGYRKSDDKLILDSKFGLQAYDNLYLSSIFNFTSQFSPGFEYSDDDVGTMVSKFFAPATITLGLGVDYKLKSNMLSLNLAPLTGNIVVVTDKELRTKYGNEEDQTTRFEFGAQLKATFNWNPFDNLKLNSTLNLFSDYLDKPQNIQIKWDFQADFRINKFLSSSLRTNLIYDDKVLIADKDGNSAPRVQFKEVLSLSFSYTFGEFKK